MSASHAPSGTTTVQDANQNDTLDDIVRVPTGIRGFDHLIEGGFPRGDLILVSGNPGSGKTIFSTEFLWNGLSEFNEPGIYVSFAENRQTLLRNPRRLSSLKMDFQQYERKGMFKFLDFASMTEKGIEDVLGIILEEVHRLRAKRLVIDSFSAIAQAFLHQNDARIIMHTVLGKMPRSSEVTTLMISEQRLGSEFSGSGMEEFVADGVVLFTQSTKRDYLARSLKIPKLRGTNAVRAELPYEIDDSGIRVYPPLGTLPAKKTITEKISTGIEGLDKMLNGGLYPGSIMLIAGAPGTGKTTAALQFIAQGALKGQKCLYITFEDPADQLVRLANSFGWNFGDPGKMNNVAFYESDLEPGRTHIPFFEAADMVEKVKPKRLVLDSASMLQKVGSRDDNFRFIRSLRSRIKADGIAAVFTDAAQSFTSTTGSDISTLVDVIVSLRHIELESSLARSIVVFKASGTSNDAGIRQFDIGPSGIVVKEKFSGAEQILSGSARRTSSAAWTSAFSGKKK